MVSLSFQGASRFRPGRRAAPGWGLVALLALVAAGDAAAQEAAGAPEAAGERPAQISASATRLEAAGRRLRLQGEVRLRWPGCRAEALEATLDLERRRLTGQGIQLRCGGSTLAAHALEGSGSRWRGRFVRFSPCGCPGEQPLVQLSAQQAWTSPDGRRLHLRSLGVLWQQRRLWLLPYWSVPLVRGVSGLSPPSLGYSSRDGLRLAQGVYLAAAPRGDLLLRGGWIQTRGAWAGLRGRWLHEGRQQAQLSLQGLQDDERWRGALQGELRLGGPRLAVGAAADLASDPSYPYQLEPALDRALLPYLRSQVWAWAEASGLYLAGKGQLLQPLRDRAWSPQSPAGSVTLELGLLPRVLLGPLLLRTEAQASHWQQTLAQPLGVGIPAPLLGSSATLLELRPTLELARPLGPLQLHAQAAYRLWGLLLWHELPGLRRVETLQRLSLASAVRLPLVRRFAGAEARLWHLLTPLVQARWQGSSAKQLVLPDGQLALGGETLALGLESALLLQRGQGPVRQLGRAEAALMLRRFAAKTTLASLLAYGSLRLGSSATPSLQGSSTVALAQGRLAALQLAGCLPWGGLRLCAGYRRFRLQSAEELYDGQGAALRPGSGLELLPLALVLDEVAGGLSWRWGGLRLAGRLAADPRRGALSQGSYSLGWAWGCGCYLAELRGQQRPGQPWPDLWLQLTFAPGGAGGAASLGSLNL